MKTIAHYFTSPKIQNEPPAERIMEGNKKQASVKVLFEKSNNKKKFVTEYIDEDNLTKKENVKIKKLKKCDQKNYEASNNLNDILVKPESNRTETVSETKSSYKSNSLIQEQKPSKEVGHNIKDLVPKNLKRKLINEKTSSRLKKRKCENKPNKSIKQNDICSNESKSKNCFDNQNTDQDVSESKLNSIKSNNKSKLYKNVIQKSSSPEQNTNEGNGPTKIKNKKKNISSKKNALEKEVINSHINYDLDNSLEIFDTKEINENDETLSPINECKLDSSDQNVDSTNVSPNNNGRRRSLFNYFSKVNKESAFLRSVENNKIKVEALVHSPPEKEASPLNTKKSLDRLSLKCKSNGLKTKTQLKSSDKIDVLSSELIEVDDVSSESENDSKRNRKFCGIESYFKSNAEGILKTPESSSKSWTMRVRLTPNSNEPVLDDDCSNQSQQADVEVINVEEDELCTPVKMFSLFKKEDKVAKPAVDYARLEAKARFLESGVPEFIKRKVDSFKSEYVLNSPAPFPRVSHVQQQEPANLCTPQWQSLTLSNHWEPVGLPLSSFPLYNQIVTIPQPAAILQAPANVKEYLQELKNQEPDVPVNTLYKSLRDKKKRFKNSCEVWTEVYKPETVSEIIGNTNNINKLKTWLQVQKNIRKREGSVSSGDEFIDSDSGAEDKARTNNVTLLTGPYGCGKTCAVYTVAKELGYEVLEINSSCNRSGKRLLTEFSESTQSHNVDHSQSVLGLFGTGCTNKLKKKKKLKIEANENNSGKTSLLLIEDADILFANHDEGFISAVATLIATSKRPVILTVNDHKRVHLTKFDSTNQLQLAFNKPRTSKLALWLRLVALVEGVELSAEQSQSLVEWSEVDVRRCLLQLQLMVQSKMLQTKPRSLSSLWWNWPSDYGIQFQLPTIFVDEEEEKLKIVDKEQIKSDINSIAKLTNNLAVIDLLSATHQWSLADNLCPKLWQPVEEHASSFSDEEVLHECVEPLHLELSDWLVKTVLSGTEQDSRCSTSSEKRWGSLLKRANELFVPAVALSQHCSHHRISTDYLPALRTLGRSEQARLVTYTKRANRYFSYLKGLGIHANKSFKDLMCDSFSHQCS